MNLNFSYKAKAIKVGLLILLMSRPILSFSQEKRNKIEQLTSDEQAASTLSSGPESVPGSIPSPSSPALPSSSRKQTEGGVNVHSVGLGVGQTFPKGDFGSNSNSAMTLLDFYYNYSASHSFDFIVNFHYNTLEKTGEGRNVTLVGLVPGIKAKLFQFDNFSPFAMGGLGFYRPEVTGYDTKTVFGLHFGGGLELKLNEKASFDIILHYHDPFSVGQKDGSDIKGFYYKLLLAGFYSF